MSYEITEAIGFMTNDSFYANKDKQKSTGTDLKPYNSKTDSYKISGNENGITIGHCGNMYPWQKEIVNSLLGGNDAYILVPPGGGKTTPYTCFWAQKIMGFNSMNVHNANGTKKDLEEVVKRITQLFKNRKSISKVLVGVPTRTLTMLQYEDFVHSFIDMFHNVMVFLVRNGSRIQELNLSQQDITSINGILNEIATYKGYNNSTTQKYAIEFKTAFSQRVILYKQYAGLKEEISRLERIPSPTSEQANKYKSVANTLKQLKDALLSLDEKLDKLGSVVFREFGKSFIAARNKVDKTGNLEDALIIIAVYESCKEIYAKLHNKIRTIVIDEAHLTQQSPSDPLNERTQNIVRVLYPILQKASKDTRILFMTGPINPDAAEQMATFMNTCFHRNFKVFSEASAGNAAKIEVIPNDSLNNDATLVDILLSRKTNNVIVLFSKKRIDQLVTAALNKSGGSRMLSDIDRETKSKRNVDDFYNQYSKYGNRPGYIQNAKKGPGATSIFDPVQRAAVASGFGFIYRPDERDPNEQQKVEDQKIVLDLFMKKKIHTIIGTDALGIGINMDVQRMYIPKAEKFSQGGMQNIPISDLSQLLNRVGRAAFKRALIYTTNDAMADVKQALDASIFNFEKRGVVTFGTFNPKFHATVDMLTQIIQDLIRTKNDKIHLPRMRK